MNSSAALPTTSPFPVTMRPRRVTVKDVAERAGVQHASVCVVLNGAKSNTHVSQAARERILMAAEELGYKRNGSMATARTGVFNSVALLLSTDQNRSNLPQRMWDGIHDELAAHNLHLTMARLPDEKLTDEGVVPKILREWMADGLLIDYTNHIPQRMLELIRSSQTPAIWLNSKHEVDCVRPDDFEAGHAATQHLLNLGHTRIVFLQFTYNINDLHEHYSVRDRLAGYGAAMEAAELSAHSITGAPEDFEGRVELLTQLLRQKERPTAIVCYGGVEAEPLSVAITQAGLAFPRELSLVVFDALAPHARILGQQLTTWVVPEYELGRCATRMLRQKIEDPTRKFAPQILKFDFKEGQTCAPPSV